MLQQLNGKSCPSQYGRYLCLMKICEHAFRSCNHVMIQVISWSAKLTQLHNVQKANQHKAEQHTSPSSSSCSYWQQNMHMRASETRVRLPPAIDLVGIVAGLYKALGSSNLAASSSNADLHLPFCVSRQLGPCSTHFQLEQAFVSQNIRQLSANST